MNDLDRPDALDPFGLDDLSAVRLLAAGLDPDRVGPCVTYDDRAVETLRRIITQTDEPQRPPRTSAQRGAPAPAPSAARHSRRRWVAVCGLGAAAAVVLGLALVPGGRTGADSAYADAPPPLAYHAQAHLLSPSALLRELADRAAAQPPLPSGKYYYVESDGGLLKDLTQGKHPVSRDFQTEHDWMWVAADGSGRIDYDVRPDRFSLHETMGPGQLDGSDLPTTPAGVRARNREAGRHAALWALAYDSGDEKLVTPRSQAAYLRVMAAAHGWVNRGTVIDRAGRAGVAISVDAHQPNGPLLQRWTLIFDPETGMPLASEVTVLNSYAGFPPPPVTESYTTILATGRTDTIG